MASAAASPLTRKIESGSSGFLWRRSLITNATSSTSAAASSAIVRALPQPWSGALTRVKTSSSIPPVARMVPRMSKSARRARWRSPLISQKIATSTSTAASGLTNITQRQPGPSVSRPPRSTPAAEASPPTAPQTPSAVLRSEPSLNVVVRIESAAGSIIAAPTPWARRAPIRTPSLPANPPISDDSADQRCAGDEDAAAAEQVGGAAAEEHEAAVGEQVAARAPTAGSAPRSAARGGSRGARC